MTKITLKQNNTIKAKVSELINHSDKVEFISKDIFLDAVNTFKEYATVKKEDILKSYINLYVSDILDNSLKSKFKRIVTNAMNYKSLNIEIVDNLNYSNIDRILSLLQFISTNKDKFDNKDLFVDVRNIINTFILNDKNNKDYYSFNNNLLEIITKLKKDNKIIEIEGELNFNFINLFNTVKNSIQYLSDEDKSKLLELLK